jgi:O-methyltransferase involved in polyketide biosynthesis
MKIQASHYEHLAAAVAPLDTAKRRAAYVAADLSDMRYRWDLTYAAKLTPWMCSTLYPYLNDDHIDTALRRIIPPLDV